MWTNLIILIISIIALLTCVYCGFHFLETAKQRKLEQEHALKAPREQCEAAGWSWFKIEHGKAAEQYICIPPVPEVINGSSEGQR